MKRVLFVCLGNICRSPMAEAIFNRQIRQKGLEMHVESDSCGTANYHVGDDPDPRTVRIAFRNATPIRHTGRQFSQTDFERFDLILPMDQSNHADLLTLPGAGRSESKIKLMRSFDPEGPGFDVPDPYYGNETDFQEVFEILDRSIRNLLGVLEQELGGLSP